ncbi:mobilization protein [Neorhizobium sp. P12A]|uniref:plasmid mobilization protein n=1 Tax=Neorhizobium sp. P12A TaxID=2268027 RepID=UPI0011F05503|nr:mobilization protein [Neorhizobium sp. P12A]
MRHSETIAAETIAAERASTGTRQRKTAIIHTRFSASEALAVDLAAKQAGMTVSAFLRSLALEGAGVEPFLNDDDRLIFDLLFQELRNVRLDLNAMTRMAHRDGAKESERENESESEALRFLIELRAVVAAIGIEVKRLAGNGRGKRRRML